NKNETDPTKFLDNGLHWDDCYEAFVIAAFFTLLIQFVGESPEEQKKKLRGREKAKLPVPCCCITYSPTGHTFLSITKWGILQYVIMKPIITFISLITEAFGVFCSESLSFAFARVYMKILTFICVTVAMYALVRLAAILVCIEMTIFSFLHIFAFPYQPYERLGDHKKVSITKGLIDSFNPIDIWKEIVYVWQTLTRRKFPKNDSDFVSTVTGEKEEKNKNENI
ncbi:10800_t:CDS:2, partial [Racocetra fulgida]